MTSLLILLFFVFFTLIMLAVAVGFKVMETHQKQRVGQVLKAVTAGDVTIETTSPLPGQSLHLTALPGDLSPLLAKVGPVKNLNAAIGAAALGWKVEAVLIAMVLLALLGGFVGYRFNALMFPWLSGLGVALALGMLPVWYIRRTGAKRLDAFERQFPDALDFVSRSVRAGHALSISLELLANESDAPLGPEFRRLTNELNLGTSLDVGMRNLAERVPLVDVRFFVSAVLLQRETGGNLTEILASLATLIRSRFRLKGHVKAVAAQGQLTAIVLSAIPICLAIALIGISPDYLRGMSEDPVGRYMILGAVLGQIVGYLIMKRIVDIKI
jgi:tight adherence protein B